MSYQMFGYCVSRCADSCCIIDALGSRQMYGDHICLEPTPDLEEEAYELVSKMFYPKHFS